ncbi:hypothetical protein DDE18_02325 [Nocardioides gansuensis]|uniref:Polysaccharide chain length determinant N-terminal domain-containing protein n=1 Tax=Nocardioides gansuensis TaxID=2138300 RepID=A0A2T8FFI1_9ACTN|nr:polysaccharide biosynthesis tyrosine autokinase [Nocardioides gansuensis]PVG84466.1 hypothetical protein DDE18_02325 [Nocardioides gansuensis]
MTLSDYVRRILVRWRTIVLVAAVVVAGVVFVTLRTTPLYTSTAQLYVSNMADDPDIEAVLAEGVHAQERVASYAAVARSEAMAERIKDDLDLPYPVDTVAGLVRTDIPFGTVVIDLATEGASPEEAQGIGEAVIEHYNELLADLEDVEGTGLTIKVSPLHEPTLPSRPSAPNVPFNILAGITAGLLLGLAAAALRDLLDRTLQGVGDLEVAGLGVLGEVPFLGRGDEEPTRTTEALRQLRAVLEGHKHRAFVVASPGPDEGATFVAAGLAEAFARTGRATVLVDGDLRTPEAGERLGPTDGPGLAGVLRGEATLDDALREVSEHLSVLPAGAPALDAGELLPTSAMHLLVRELRERFAVVVVDGPPLRAFADSGVIARHVDGIVVVAARERTTGPELAAAVDGLVAVRATVLGGVLNRARADRRDGFDAFAAAARQG